MRDRTELIQLMEDVLLALLPKKEQQNEWVAGSLGILRGVAFRFWDEFPEHCTLPHILAFIMTARQGSSPCSCSRTSCRKCWPAPI